VLVQFTGSIPIYEQIMRYIKKEIITGELNGEDKIPSVRDLADRLSVNPNTVSRAYQELEREGLTETRRGMGTYIVGDKTIKDRIKKELSQDLVLDFIEEMKASGFTAEEIIGFVSERLEKETL
jgi:GntR family transcriptional regulator